MGIFASLSRSQKEAVGLLQIGTFLEYFDLMLYVHMAVLLNELFFPKTDPHTAALITAFAFCTTYALRPFGALLFGWIGDNIGRKPTVIITTTMMSLSCVVMANLPTYAQVGISAAWIVTLCRAIQGLSSMGEVVGAQVYVSELVKPPSQFPAVGFISVATAIGAFVALGFATMVTRYEYNWRIAFWAGAGIAVIGSIARTRLRETPNFIEAKNLKKSSTSVNLKTSKQTLWHLLAIYFGWPLSFYVAYMYFNPLLKDKFWYSSEQIIEHNLIIAFFSLISLITVSILSSRINPLCILRVKGWVTLFLVSITPFYITKITDASHLLLLQSLLIIFALDVCPALPIFFNALPVLKRITATSFIYAASRALIYIITSFGLVYCSEIIGNFGLWVISIPVCFAFLCGVNYFEKLENKNKDKNSNTKQHQDHTPLSTEPNEIKLAG